MLGSRLPVKEPVMTGSSLHLMGFTLLHKFIAMQNTFKAGQMQVQRRSTAPANEFFCQTDVINTNPKPTGTGLRFFSHFILAQKSN